MIRKKIKIELIETNEGQILGVPKNPRYIKDAEFEKLKQSIKDFPEMLEIREVVVFPLNGRYIALGGNMRFLGCKDLGYKEIDCVILPADMPAEKLREFAIKDNGNFGAWDFDMLANEWDLELLDMANVTIPNFELPEETPEATEDNYEIPETIKTNIVKGDLFEIGNHRLLCGDSTDSEQVARLMQGEKADITFTSPPYNVGKTPNGNDSKYLNDSDKKSISDYVNLLDSFTKNALLFSDYVFSNIQSLSGNKIALIEHLYNLRNVYADVMIWDKMTAEPAMARKVLNSRFEYVYIFSNEAKRSIGKKDFRGTIDNIFTLNSRQGKEYSSFHKATFPVQLPSLFIESFTESSIIDMFCGTGTTMVAAHQLQIKCYGLELSENYCQVIIERMLKLDPTLIVKKNGVVTNEFQ